MHKGICLTLIVSLIFSPSLGYSASSDLNVDKDVHTTGSEYVLRNYPDEPLMTVQVLGGVNKPGIYHVPKGTDIVTIMSLTGGVYENANLNEILLRKRKSKKISLIDLDDMIGDIKTQPDKLDNGDIVLISMKEKSVSDNTLRIATYVSVLLGIVTAGIFISKETK